MTRPVQLRITGDSASAVRAVDVTEAQLRDLNRTARRTDSTLSSLKRGLAGIGGAILAGNTLGAGISLIKESVGLASGLAETTSKVSTVFGKSSKGIMDWARTTDAAMSMSQRAILDTVTGFDLLLTNRGLGATAAKSMSKELTSLAADLSSFFNTSTQDAADALSSALRGEMDPIERFGVSLDEATLKARAYAMGLYSGKGSLTATAKAQAAYAEILKQTSKAQGDLGRTQGSASNQIRQFKTNVEGLKTTLGTAFTPLIERYLPGINEWMTSINSQEMADKLGKGLLDVADIIETKVWPKLQELGKSLRDAFSGVNAEDAEGALKGLGTAAERIAGGVGSIFEAFGNLSPEAQANIATIVAAGTALTVLTRSNPVIRIGVGLAADVIGTVATAVINRVIQGTQPVRVTNWPKVFPDGDGGGGSDGGKKGRTGPAAVAGGVGKAGVAALVASILPSVVEHLPIPQGWKENIGGIASAAVLTALVPGGPLVKGIALALGLAAQFGRQWDGLTALTTYVTGPQGIPAVKSDVQQLTSYVTGPQGIPAVKRDVRHVESDLEREKGSRRSGDDKNAGDIDAESGRRRSRDNEHDDRLDNHARALARLRETARLLRGSPEFPARPGDARAATAAAVTNNYYSISVDGAGSPAQTAREIDRYLRRAGNRSTASVGAP